MKKICRWTSRWSGYHSDFSYQYFWPLNKLERRLSELQHKTASFYNSRSSAPGCIINDIYRSQSMSQVLMLFIAWMFGTLRLLEQRKWDEIFLNYYNMCHLDGMRAIKRELPLLPPFNFMWTSWIRKVPRYPRRTQMPYGLRLRGGGNCIHGPLWYNRWSPMRWRAELSLHIKFLEKVVVRCCPFQKSIFHL